MGNFLQILTPVPVPRDSDELVQSWGHWQLSLKKKALEMIPVESQGTTGWHEVTYQILPLLGGSIWQKTELRLREGSGSIYHHTVQAHSGILSLDLKTCLKLATSKIKWQNFYSEGDPQFIKHFRIITTFYSYNNPVQQAGKLFLLLLLLLLHHCLHFKDEETEAQSVSHFLTYSLTHCSVILLALSAFLSGSLLCQPKYAQPHPTWAHRHSSTTSMDQSPSSHPTPQNNGNNCNHRTPACSQPEKQSIGHLKRRLWLCASCSAGGPLMEVAVTAAKRGRKNKSRVQPEDQPELYQGRSGSGPSIQNKESFIYLSVGLTGIAKSAWAFICAFIIYLYLSPLSVHHSSATSPACLHWPPSPNSIHVQQCSTSHTPRVPPDGSPQHFLSSDLWYFFLISLLVVCLLHWTVSSMRKEIMQDRAWNSGL